MTRRQLVARIGAAVVGVALLILVAPHTNPWSMRWLTIDPLTSTLRPFGLTPGIPFGSLFLVAAVVCLVPWLTLRGKREASSGGGVRGGQALLYAACAGTLIVSLIPAAARGRGFVADLLLSSAGIVLVVSGLSGAAAPRWLDRRARGLVRRVRDAPRVAVLLGAFLAVFVAANLGSYFLLGHVPHVVDSADQLFHARIFLEGRLCAPLPLPEESFDFTHMINGECWYSQYPPGHTLLLALGLLVGAPWLLNPLLGALSVVLIYFVGREAFSEPIGRWSAIVGALSPFVWIMSSSHMSHATAMFFLALFLFAFVRAIRTGSAWAASLSGFAAGFALNARPMTAAAFVAPFALYGAFDSFRLLAKGTGWTRSRRIVRTWLPALAGFAVPLAGLLFFNEMTNGDPFLFGYEVAHGAEALPGFGRGGFWGVPHTPWRGVAATLNNLNAMNRYLFGLAVPSLALPVLGFAVLRRTLWDWLLAACAASLVAAHFFYWYQDLAYGPRFLYSAVIPLVLLTVRSLSALPEALERRFPGRQVAGRVGLVILAAFVYGYGVNVPAMADFYSRNFYDVNPRIPQTIAAARLERAVVFVPEFHYASVFPLNDPLFEGDVIYARDRGASMNGRVARRFPARSLYRLRAHQDYSWVSYDPSNDDAPVQHRLEAARPFELEVLSFQVSYLHQGALRDLGTGATGGLFKNHDQLWISATDPGMEVGFILDADHDVTKTLRLRLTRSPDSGVVEIRMNGVSVRTALDLYAERVEVFEVTIHDVALEQGGNGLMLRVVGRNPASSGLGLGLDTIRLE